MVVAEYSLYQVHSDPKCNNPSVAGTNFNWWNQRTEPEGLTRKLFPVSCVLSFDIEMTFNIPTAGQYHSSRKYRTNWEGESRLSREYRIAEKGTNFKNIASIYNTKILKEKHWFQVCGTRGRNEANETPGYNFINLQLSQPQGQRNDTSLNAMKLG